MKGSVDPQVLNDILWQLRALYAISMHGVSRFLLIFQYFRRHCSVPQVKQRGCQKLQLSKVFASQQLASKEKFFGSEYSIVKDSNANLTVENWNFKICPLGGVKSLVSRYIEGYSFWGYLRTLSLKFQKARTKIKVVLTLAR